MSTFILGLAVIFAGGFVSFLAGRKPSIASFFACAGAVTGSVISIIPCVMVLSSGAALSFSCNWNIPFGSFSIEIDAISALFLIPILGLSAVAAVYGVGYLSSYSDRKNLGVHWFFYNLLLITMALVVVSRNGLLFLISWEIMSLSSFFLVTFDYERPETLRAGLIYLIATHIGTAFLIAFFILLGRQAGSLDFDSIPALSPSLAGILFVLAIIGFGTKAGFMPLHVWLPYAHPAAPSHVSAVMSGVMIKTGIYGLVRTITLLGAPSEWWCWLLIIIGATSGILGVLFALAQHDLKRLLAYHSVENIGIITIGLGVGLLGIYKGSPLLAVLGFTGGLFHVINHAVFKGLLFLCAGSVLHSCGTGHIDRLGGLIKRMPWTACTFLIGAIAISGLPPLNGFVSEFLIYLGVFKSGTGSGTDALIPVLVVIGSMALIGGLALACFTKAFSVIFLGFPRNNSAEYAHEAGTTMKFAMVTLAACCFVLGIFSPLVVKSIENVIIEIAPMNPENIQTELASASAILGHVVLVLIILLGTIGFITVLRKYLFGKRTIRQAVTWDCGYARPSPAMQYTATSFAQPLVDLFKFFLRTRKNISISQEIFPLESKLHTDTPDISEKYFYKPVFSVVSNYLVRLHWLQHGRLQFYILYIALILWILLIWKLI
jgi:hydrogenase-4 component B